MVADQTLIAVGLGCRKGCPADEIVDLVRRALAATRLARTPIGLFTIEHKRGERGLSEAGIVLGLPLIFLDKTILAAHTSASRTLSTRSLALFGVSSVAETAALAGAGPEATLIMSRLASPRATCAIAARPG